MTKFKYSQRGTTLTETAIALPIFLAVILAAMELGLLFWADLELERGAGAASRALLTGTQQADGLKAIICGNVAILQDCENRTRVDVRVLNNFSDIGSQNIDAHNSVTNSIKADGDFRQDTVSGEDLVVLTIFYEWPLINVMPPGFTFNLSAANNGRYYLRATSAFVTEPF